MSVNRRRRSGKCGPRRRKACFSGAFSRKVSREKAVRFADQGPVAKEETAHAGDDEVPLRRRRRPINQPPFAGIEVMTMKKSTLFVTLGAAALLNVACASTKAEEKPAEAAPAADAAAAPAADAAAPADAAKAPEGSCGGEKKPEG